MATALMGGTSRSIIANRLNRFATLYDPDNEPGAEEAEPSLPRNPKKVREHGQNLILPLVMGPYQYSKYRRILLERDPHCAYCGCELNVETSSLDHLIAESRGGENWRWNLVLSCLPCNTTKSDLTPLEWREVLLSQIEVIVAQLKGLQETAERLAQIHDQHRLDRHVVQPRKTTEPPVKKSRPPSDSNIISTWQPQDFEHGNRTYWIVESTDNRPILRHLGINQAMHVLETLGTDGLQLMMLTPLYHEVLGTKKPDPSQRREIYYPAAAQDGKAVQQ